MRGNDTHAAAYGGRTAVLGLCLFASCAGSDGSANAQTGTSTTTGNQDGGNEVSSSDAGSAVTTTGATRTSSSSSGAGAAQTSSSSSGSDSEPSPPPNGTVLTVLNAITSETNPELFSYTLIRLDGVIVSRGWNSHSQILAIGPGRHEVELRLGATPTDLGEPLTSWTLDFGQDQTHLILMGGSADDGEAWAFHMDTTAVFGAKADQLLLANLLPSDEATTFTVDDVPTVVEPRSFDVVTVEPTDDVSVDTEFGPGSVGPPDPLDVDEDGWVVRFCLVGDLPPHDTCRVVSSAP